MTFPPPGPPAEDYPDDDRTPPGYGYGPAPGHPPGYPPPGYGHHPAPQQQSRLSVGLAFVGALLYILINSVLGFAAFLVGASTTNVDAVFGGTAVLLLLTAFGGGAALLAAKSPHARGLGLGLMIGWALTSLVTVGICTGINPTLYTT